MKQLILAYGSILDQGTKEFSSSLYNSLHKGESVLSPDPSTLSEYFTTTMADILPLNLGFLLLLHMEPNILSVKTLAYLPQ